MNPQEIKKLVKIEDVIATYIKILNNSKPNDYRALCPFHQETEPSFSINTEKQFFHCFGCKEGGDVFKFVELIEKVSFPEAVKIVSTLAGLETEEITELELLKEVCDFFQNKVEDNIEYFKQSNLDDPQIIKYFKLGFEDNRGDQLSKEFSDYIQILKELGLVKIQLEGTKDEFGYSKMTNRMIFPAISRLGIVNFSGRTVIGNNAKYLNLVDNRFFGRDWFLYGLYDAIEKITERDEVNIVEGQKDVIRMKFNGFLNTVGAFGTSFTETQAKILKRYTNNFIFLFDGDEAGVKAAKRASLICMKFGINPRFKALPEGEDPDSYLLSGKSIKSLEELSLIDVVTNLFERDQIINFINDPLPSLSYIPEEILSFFKINPALVKKKNSQVLLAPRTKIVKFSGLSHLALLVDAFPFLRKLLTAEELEQVETEIYAKEVLNLISTNKNFYAGIKSPETVFNKLKEGVFNGA